MTRLLLTGAGGQLGEAVRRLAGAEWALIALTRADLDIADEAAVASALDTHRPEIIVNAAAYTAVDKAENEPELAFRVNRDGPGHLAGRAVERGIPILHISTDYVFDGTRATGYREDDPTNPLGVYGASKLAGEAAVLASGATSLIVRTSWLYGVAGGNFVKTMLRLAGERDELRVVDDQFGCPTFADDLALCVLELAGRLARGAIAPEALGIVHAAGAEAMSWAAFARAIVATAMAEEARPRVTPITTAEFPTPARRPANSVLATDKLAGLHGLHLPGASDALPRMLAALHSAA